MITLLENEVNRHEKMHSFFTEACAWGTHIITKTPTIFHAWK